MMEYNEFMDAFESVLPVLPFPEKPTMCRKATREEVARMQTGPGYLVNPITLSYLVHFHWCPTSPPNVDSQSGREAIGRLLKLGAIRRKNGTELNATQNAVDDEEDDVEPLVSEYTTTALGKAWINMMVNQAPPTPVYLDSEGNVIKD